MSGIYSYVAFDGSWSVNLGQQAVRLASVSGFTELAELGAVGESSLIIDDPSGTVGHASDAILALQQFFYDDTRAAIQRVYAGWTDQRQYVRGDSARPSLRTGVARQIQVHIRDGNTLAGRLHFAPATVDATVKRPQETALARITWLLGTAYLPGVADHGQVRIGNALLDPNDYSDQTPADLLNHCCDATGDNWFIYWDRTAGAWALAVFNMTTYNGYLGTLQLSNDLSIIDSNLDGKWTAGATDTWAIEPDALMTRDPSHYCDRVSLPYAKGTEYVVGSSTKFPDVTRSAPSTSVKTAAAALAKANRFLTDNAEEFDRITCSAKIGAANVNDALPGQLIKASFTHFPGYASLTDFRISRRTVSQVEPTDQFYHCEYELVPVTPITPTFTFGQLQYCAGVDSLGYEPANGSPWLISWWATGDAPRGGWSAFPKTGKVAYDTTSAPDASHWTGLKVSGSGNIDIIMVASCGTVWKGGTINFSIAKNGVVIATNSITDPVGGGGLRSFGGECTVTASAVAVVSTDIITGQILINSAIEPHGGFVPGSVPGLNTEYLQLQGYLT